MAVYTDNFDRADAASLGGNWVGVSGAQFGIKGNQAYPNGANWIAAYYNQPFSADYYSKVVIGLLPGTVSGVGAAVNCDATHGGIVGVDTSVMWLRGNAIPNSKPAIAGNPGDVIHAEVRSGILHLFVNDQIKFLLALGTLYGRPGIGGYGTNNAYTLDSWEGGDLPAFSTDEVTGSVIDNFTAANGTLARPSGPWRCAFDLLDGNISSGKLIFPTSGGAGWKALVRQTETFPANQRSIVTVDITSGAIKHGPAVRIPRSGNSGGYYGLVAGLAGWEINRFDGAIRTALTGNLFTPVAGDVLALEVEGSNLRAYRNGALVGSATDATYTSGNPGIVGFTETTTVIRQWVGDPLNTNRQPMIFVA